MQSLSRRPCPENDGRRSLKSKCKSFVNPLFICVFVGVAIGFSGITIPPFIKSLITSTGNCMSPVSMLITGMVISKTDIISVLKRGSIYAVSLIRLLAYPAAFLVIYLLCGKCFDKTFVICAVASLAMPLGLNTIILPSAYGKDTSAASGMALISHVLSVATIPIIFFAAELLIK